MVRALIVVVSSPTWTGQAGCERFEANSPVNLTGSVNPIRWINNFLALSTGPLFQQRPYPSPGAVLRKNAEIASQKKKPNSNYASISKRGDGSDGLGDAD
ncbi:hypothetical protein RJ639_016641 [Escallonia herrerae]|uniref:Uncharacterized protein n=1 Tax=Escallonia herrerae TaxID=1293975 RepID=A0AA88VBV5_9ASTE|nr:hypothetical protein RJ639_016641 [Escallonia herrerae]